MSDRQPSGGGESGTARGRAVPFARRTMGALLGAHLGSETATDCSQPVWIVAVMRAAHRLWRHETRTKLRDTTKASQRTVDYWRAKRKPQMSAEHLVELMRAAPAQFVPAVLGQSAYEALAREIVQQAKVEQLEREIKAKGDEIRRLLQEQKAGA